MAQGGSLLAQRGFKTPPGGSHFPLCINKYHLCQIRTQCYAKGRKRVWWEIEIIVGKEIRDLPGYPEWQKPFMAVTDDGWKFQVWTCGGSEGKPDKNKNLYSKDDLKIMGRWIKGRLVAAGLVDPINTVEKDTEGKGVITEEMLRKYGRTTITLTKTELKTITENGDQPCVYHQNGS